MKWSTRWKRRDRLIEKREQSVMHPPARPSPAQNTWLSLQKLQAQSNLVSLNALLVLLVIYAYFRFPSKYVRVIGPCQSNWLHLDSHPDEFELVCCGGKEGSRHAAPCYPGMDSISILSTLQGAWAIPLIPLIINYVCVMLGPNATLPRIRVLTRRGLLYLFIMAFRTFVLYAGIGAMEDIIVTTVSGRSPNECWYGPLRKSGKCISQFDHADHVVLLSSHYLAIMAFEWFALSVESSVHWTKSVKKLALRGIMLFIGAIALYAMFFTTAYFHSPMENIAGLVIGQLTIMYPLYLIVSDEFPTKYFRLNNFVALPIVETKGL